MHMAIVDDSLADASRLEKFLRQYCEERSLTCTAVYYQSATDFFEHYQPCFDLVIMDIDMPGIGGVDAARRLRAEGDDVVLIFVTNMPQYALAGFEVGAVDYIFKPVTYQTFTLKLERALRFVQRNRRHSICGVGSALSDLSYSTRELQGARHNGSGRKGTEALSLCSMQFWAFGQLALCKVDRKRGCDTW